MMKELFVNTNTDKKYACFSPNKSKLTESSYSQLSQNFKFTEKYRGDYYFQEFKNAKNQGYFDITSPGNKSIFGDNNHENKNKKCKSEVNKKLKPHHNDGKNLLILESHSEYPIISYKRRVNKRNILTYSDKDYDNKTIQSLNYKGTVELNRLTQSPYNLKNNYNLSNNYHNIVNTSLVIDEEDIDNEYYEREYNKKFLAKSNINWQSKGKIINKNYNKLMDIYRNKLVNLFMDNIINFLKKYKKKLMDYFISKIKKYIINKEKNYILFENIKTNQKNVNKKNYFKSNKELKNITDYSNKVNNNYSNNFLFQKKYVFNNESIDKINEKYINANSTIYKNKNRKNNVFKKKIVNSSYKDKKHNKEKYFPKINKENSSLDKYVLKNNNAEYTKVNLTKSVNPYLSKKTINDNMKRNKNNQSFSSLIITKKSPKYKFSNKNSQNLTKENISFNNSKLNQKKEEINAKINLFEVFNYLSSDNKLNIIIKYLFYDNNSIVWNKNKEFCETFTITNFNFSLVNEIQKMNNNKSLCTPETNSENLCNSNYNMNINNINFSINGNNSGISQGILLLQNYIYKNYEEKFDPDISVESKSININDLNESINKKQLEKNDSLLKDIIITFDNRNKLNQLKNYFQILKDETKETNPLYLGEDKKEFNEEIKQIIVDKEIININNELEEGSLNEEISNKLISSKNVNETDEKQKNESIDESYRKYENFISSLRLQLICCYLNKKGNSA